MTWVKLDDSFYDNPKLEVIPDVAFRMWVCAIGYCGRHLTDGFIPVTKLSRIVAARRHQSVIKVLVEAGLFEQVEGGYIVHDYLQYNPSREDVAKEREENARRQAAFRTRRNTLVTPLVTPLLTAPRTRPVVPKGTNSERESMAGAAAPVHTPEEKPTETVTTAEAREVFDYYKAHVQPGARSFPPDIIKARIRKFGLDDCKLAVDHFKADDWEMGKNSHRGAEWFFAKNQRIEQYICMDPSRRNGKATAGKECKDWVD